MLQKTRGIVFHTTDYSETSIVAKIYTEDFGVQSYLVNSVRKRHAKVRASLFQPLTLVEVVAYNKERGGLQRISEIRNTVQYRDIPFDPVKSSMVLFLNEVLYRSVREEESNPTLFEFLFNSLQVLDLQSPLNPSYHLLFLLRLTRFLGFFPHGNYTAINSIFNLQDGVFQAVPPSHPHFLISSESEYFYRLLEWTGENEFVPEMKSELRRLLIERVLEYYRLHIGGFGEVRSHLILEQVWS
jgi:DNA repair protein RecO (recombination protein O)